MTERTRIGRLCRSGAVIDDPDDRAAAQAMYELDLAKRRFVWVMWPATALFAAAVAIALFVQAWLWALYFSLFVGLFFLVRRYSARLRIEMDKTAALNGWLG